MSNLDNQTIQLIFIAVTAMAVLLQAIILLAIYVAVRRATNSVREEVEDLRSSVMPIIETARDLIVRVGPKIEMTTAELAEIAHGLRVQTTQMESSVNEILERVHRQSKRVDSMFTGVLDAVEKVGGFVAESVSKPVRQFSGVLASLKAIIESLREGQATPHPGPGPAQQPPLRHAQAPARPAPDEDMFV
jgi:hypothetical protein